MHTLYRRRGVFGRRSLANHSVGPGSRYRKNKTDSTGEDRKGTGVGGVTHSRVSDPEEPLQRKGDPKCNPGGHSPVALVPCAKKIVFDFDPCYDI